jgi:hypothetical protein
MQVLYKKQNQKQIVRKWRFFRKKLQFFQGFLRQVLAHTEAE